jgi:hypothetical protein
MLLYAGSDSYTEFSPDLWYALKKLGSKVTGIKERSDNNSGPPLPKMAYSGLLAPQGKLASAGDWGDGTHPSNSNSWQARKHC